MQLDPYRLADLMAKYLRNELSEEEEIQLNHFLKESEENKELLESFRDTASVQEEIDFISKLDVDKAWNRLNRRRKPAFIKKYRFQIGAAVLLLCAFTLFWLLPVKNEHDQGLQFALKIKKDVLPASNKAQLVLSSGQTVYLDQERNSLQEIDGTLISGRDGELNYENDWDEKSNELIYNTLKVPSSGTYRLKLPDGSKVWVNASSELRFPVSFGKKERKVYLKGEAYFEVAKDASRPFKVEVDQTEVEVLGTHFNVRSYSAEVATTLVEGAVKIRYQHKQVVLSPGEEAKTMVNGIQTQKVNLMKATAWKNNVFYFEGDNIRDIMEEIARWYDVDINYIGKIPLDRYKGIVSRDVKLSSVLEMLSFISGKSFEISERSVTVRF